MKTKMMSLITVMLFVGMTSLFAQQVKTEKIKVNGECGMCKKRIEKAANSVEGVSKAEWSDKTKILLVTYDPSKTDVKKVSTAVAKVGYDTEGVKAEEKDYKSLPACCQYDRKKEIKD